jgi:hypothetical protein
VLVAILRKQRQLLYSLYTILQILSLTLFEKRPILQVLSQQPQLIVMPHDEKQLYLPGF